VVPLFSNSFPFRDIQIPQLHKSWAFL
jgi:RimJ/RimL family protein N-acetyltransferase